MIRTLALLAGLVALGTSAADVEKATKAAQAFLEKGKAGSATLAPIDDPEVLKCFGKQTVFSVRFQQFPVAMAPAEGYATNNLLFVPEKGEPKLLTKAVDVMKLFEQIPARDDKTALVNVKALLALEREMVQDGHYTFKPVEDSFKVTRQGGKTFAKGMLDVTEGGTGGISVTLVYEKDGKVAGTSVGPFVKPGPRPRRLGD